MPEDTTIEEARNRRAPISGVTVLLLWCASVTAFATGVAWLSEGRFPGLYHLCVVFVAAFVLTILGIAIIYFQRIGEDIRDIKRQVEHIEFLLNLYKS